MKTTQILKDEHRVIEQVLTCLERMAAQAKRDRKLPVAAARDAIEFFRHFADHCHHAKEENQLFPVLEKKGFSPDSGPTAVMRFEHTQGREYVRAMSAAADAAERGETTAVDQFTRNARGYIELLSNHIAKEDHCLFSMADNVLTEADDAALLEAFEHVEHVDIGAGCHEKFVRLADRLAETYGVSRATAPLARTLSAGACSHAKPIGV